MRVKLFTLRYSETLGGFDDTPLQDYTRDKELLCFREHFFTVHDTPHLACVLTTQEPVIHSATLAAARQVAADDPATQPTAPRHRTRKRPSDPTAGLDEAERALFNTLRAWRLDQARTQGIPPYVILRNRDLIALVKKRPESRTTLGHIDGIGPKTIERYGDAILRLLRSPVPQQTPPANRSAPRGSRAAERFVLSGASKAIGVEGSEATKERSRRTRPTEKTAVPPSNSAATSAPTNLTAEATA